MSTLIQTLVLDPANPGHARLHAMTPTLTSMQAVVGGYIEAVSMGPEADCVMYVHSEGKTMGLPVNSDATALLRAVGAALAPDDYIAGPALICGTQDQAGTLDGEDHDATEWARRTCRSVGLRVDEAETPK